MKAASAAVGVMASVVGILASLGLLTGRDADTITRVANLGSAPPTGAAFDRYEGETFSLLSPQQWKISTSNGAASGSSTTTFANPDAAGVLVRVDVSPNSAEAPAVVATRALAATLKPGYRRLGIGVTTVAGNEGLKWDYLLREAGTELRRTEVVFTDTRGNGYAIVTQAPVAVFGRWQRTLGEVRESFVPTAV